VPPTEAHDLFASTGYKPALDQIEASLEQAISASS
jgi:hypothetical protein